MKSSAIRLGANTRPWLWVFYGLAVALLAGAFWQAGLRWPSFGLLALAAAQLAHQAATVDLDDATDCLAKFKSNRFAGLIVLGAIIAGGTAFV